jgi:hypothetical protein
MSSCANTTYASARPSSAWRPTPYTAAIALLPAVALTQLEVHRVMPRCPCTQAPTVTAGSMHSREHAEALTAYCASTAELVIQYLQAPV